MADRRTVVTLSVQDDFSRQLQAFARQMAEADRATQNMGNAAKSGGGLKAFNEQLFFMSQNAMLVYNTFTRVFSTADQWAQLGFGVTKSYMALDKLTGSAQESKAWIDAITGSLNNTVTSSEAASQAYMLMRFNMAGTADEAGQFARDIAIVAQANAQLHGDVGLALQQVQLTIANQSTMRLDQLGLSVSSVTERIKALQAATPGLSRELAFQQAVMEGLHDEANMLGDDFLAVGANTAQVKTQMRELREEIGVKVSNAMETAAESALRLETILGRLGAKETVVRIVTEVAGEQAGLGTENWLNMALYGPMMGARQLGLIGPSEKPGQAPSSGLDIYGTNLPPAGAQLGAGEGYWVSDGDQWIFYSTSPLSTPRPAPTSLIYPGMPGYQESLNAQVAPGFMGPVTGQFSQGGDNFRFDTITAVQDAVRETLRYSDELATTWASDITDAVSDVAGALADGVSATSDMVDSARDVAAEFERLQNMSLEEVFGIDATRFATDVGGEIAQALRDAGVEGQAASDAMLSYQIQTGLATGASEVFARGMDDLAQKLANGTLSADEYVAAVMRLSTTDFSWTNQVAQTLIDEGDVAAAQHYLDVVAQYSYLFTGPQYTTSADFGETGLDTGYLDQVPPSKGESMAYNPFAQMMVDTQTMIDLLKADNPLKVDTTDANAAVGQFQDFVEGVVGAKYRLGVEVYATNATLNVPLNIVPSTSAETPPLAPHGLQIEEYDLGGAIPGSGPRAMIGHGGEYVVPQNGALVLRGGGAEQPIVVDNHVHVEIDSREIDAAARKQKRLRNDRYER